MELCMREKPVFFLPVNILTVWSPAFLAVRHTTVCLDYRNKRSFDTYVCEKNNLSPQAPKKLGERFLKKKQRN